MFPLILTFLLSWALLYIYGHLLFGTLVHNGVGGILYSSFGGVELNELRPIDLSSAYCAMTSSWTVSHPEDSVDKICHSYWWLSGEPLKSTFSKNLEP